MKEGCWILSLALLFIFAGLSGTGFAAQKSDIKIGLPVQATSFLPVYVANEKKFFREAGLNTETILFRGDAGVVQAIVGGSLDINVASLNGLLGAISAGQKLKAFWGGYNSADFAWYAAKEITSTKDLKGKKFAVSSFGSLTDALTRFLIQKSSLDPQKDVQILQIGGTPAMLTALRTGRVDVAILSPPTKFAAQTEGFNKLFDQRTGIAKEWPKHVVYSTESFIKENPETIRSFIRATAKAIRFAKSNRDESIQIISKVFKMKKDFAALAYDDVIDYLYADGRLPDPESMDTFWRISIQTGDVKEKWPQEKYFDDSFAKTQKEWLR